MTNWEATGFAWPTGVGGPLGERSASAAIWRRAGALGGCRGRVRKIFRPRRSARAQLASGTGKEASHGKDKREKGRKGRAPACFVLLPLSDGRCRSPASACDPSGKLLPTAALLPAGAGQVDPQAALFPVWKLLPVAHP